MRDEGVREKRKGERPINARVPPYHKFNGPVTQKSRSGKRG